MPVTHTGFRAVPVIWVWSPGPQRHLSPAHSNQRFVVFSSTTSLTVWGCLLG